ncbi:IF44L-like protein, partial [Mya arenaria]
MAGKLTEADMDQLDQWIGSGPKTFTLLYSITRDGCNATTFHQKCDNQGPTVTENVQRARVCLRRVRWYKLGPKQHLPERKTKFHVANSNHGHYCQHNFGPTFGGSHNLLTFKDNVTSSSCVFALNGYVKINDNYYRMTGVSPKVSSWDDINNGTMNVTELEVYKITGYPNSRVVNIYGQRKKVLPNPWRRTPDLNEKFLRDLTEELEKMSPVIETLDAYRILLLGPVGSGKSSFCNTVTSAFRGRITQRAICGSGDRSKTTL